MGTAWLFGAVAVANLLCAIYLNTRILTDDVYRSIWAGQGSSGQIDALLTMTRRWELVGYLAGPVALLVRVAFAALLVQLALLVLGLRSRLSPIFRAGVWAQIPLVARTLAQMVWLSFLPEAARTAERLQAMPGTLVGLFASLESLGPGWALLLERVTLFDLGWIVFFALALEDGNRISQNASFVAVGSVWALITLSQWTAWLYLMRLG